MSLLKGPTVVWVLQFETVFHDLLHMTPPNARLYAILYKIIRIKLPP